MKSATAGGKSLQSCPRCGNDLTSGSFRCPACGETASESFSAEELVDRIRQDLQTSPLQNFKKRFHGLWDVQHFFFIIREHPWVSGGVILGLLILAGSLWFGHAYPRIDSQELRLELERSLVVQQLAALKSLQEGERLLDARDYANAHAAFSTAIKSGADDKYAHFLRGLASAQLGKHLNAIKDFSIVAGLDPENAEVLARRGLAFESLGSYWQAIRDYHQALNANGDDSPAAAEIYFYQSRAYSRLGDYPQALAAISKAIELGQAGPQFYYQRALLQDRLELYPQALKDYDRALRTDSTLEQVYLKRGSIQVKLQNYEQALPDLTRAIALAPQDSQAYYQRGLAQAHLGSYEPAVRDLETASRLGSPEARYMLTSVVKAVKQQEKSAKQRLAAAKTQNSSGDSWKSKSGSSKGKRSRGRRR